MAARPEIRVEFYGVPRLRAGRADLTVAAATVAEALGAVEKACPGLERLWQGSQLRPEFLLSLNGERFVGDLTQRLKSGDCLLILSADVGG